MIQSMGTVICPQCFAVVPAREAARFCPHCGLVNVVQEAEDRRPIALSIDGTDYQIGDRLALSALCTLYRCRITANGQSRTGIFKIARDARCNQAVAHEAQILRQLQVADASGHFGPFFPRLVSSFAYNNPASEPARQVNVLVFHADIHSPDELYTLDEVSAVVPAGLDARDVAWIWRRLLHLLAFIHAEKIVHAAVLPANVLIEPNDHKLILSEWCFANASGENADAVSGKYQKWFERDCMVRPATPALDIALGARCMVQLLAGDPIRGECPTSVDPAIERYFQRCLAMPEDCAVPAGQLLGEFDQLIEALWGPRQFRPLTLPSKRPT